MKAKPRNAAPAVSEISAKKAVSTPVVTVKIEGGHHYLFISILALIYLTMIIIVNPIGNFPLNDDWVYAHPVSSLITNGTYGSQGWAAATIVVQVIWGWLFCLFTGFSYTALRISTLVLGLAGIIIFYFLIYELSKNKKLSFLSALLLLANPLYFSLSNTFMTDVPFVSLSLFSIYFFFKVLNKPNTRYLILATLFSVLATLVRQFAMVIPLAYVITAFIRYKQPVLKKLNYLMPLFITALAYETDVLWLKHIGSELFVYPSSTNPTLLSFFSSPKKWLVEIAIRFGNILFYFGMLFFPMLIAVKIRYSDLLKSFKIKLIAILLSAGIAAAYILYYRFFPYINILNDDSIGPNTLSVYEFSQNLNFYHDHLSPKLLVLYFLGISGAILLIIHIFTVIMNMSWGLRKPGVSVSITVNSRDILSDKLFFTGLCLTGYILLIFVPSTQFDRYLVPTFPLFCLLVITEPASLRFAKVPVVIFNSVYVLIIILSTAFGTHDYLAWNRARWQAVNYLTNDKHISMHQIDAGYEANGWLLGYGLKYDVNKVWGGIIDGNEYILSFGEAEGYQPLNKFPYKSYLPPYGRSVFVSCNIVSILNSGYNLLKKGKTDSAENIFKTLMVQTGNKNVPHLHNYFGMLYAKKNMPKEAEQEFKKEISLNLQKEESYFQLGMLYFQKKDYDNAIQAWDSTVAINPSNADAHNNLGVCYQNYKKDIKKAQEYFTNSVKLDPDYTQGYYNLLVCAQNNSDKKSLVAYTKILLHKGVSINDIKARGISISDDLLKLITAP